LLETVAKSVGWLHGRCVSTAAIYAAIGKSRSDWAEHPAIHGLVDEVHGVLDRAGGATPLAAAGTELLTRIAHGDHPDNVARASALVRVVAELDKDEPDGIRFVRLEGDTPWLLRREDRELPLKVLGAAADELASREVLAGPAEAHRALEAIAAGTPLATLAADRLVRLAAAASRRASASSRLELYPRKMAGQRALELSAAILPGKITEPKLRELVEARYPDAAPLPLRPALDELVKTFYLDYLPEEAVYARTGSDPRARGQGADVPRAPRAARARGIRRACARRRARAGEAVRAGAAVGTVMAVGLLGQFVMWIVPETRLLRAWRLRRHLLVRLGLARFAFLHSCMARVRHVLRFDDAMQSSFRPTGSWDPGRYLASHAKFQFGGMRAVARKTG
jgi:hypothetical protein